MSEAQAPLISLLELQTHFPRGPRREGAFAVWLVVREALEIGLNDYSKDKGESQRVVLLHQRVKGMALPPPLLRGLTIAIKQLEGLKGADARVALAQLVVPTKDSLGSEAADAVAHAARLIHVRRGAETP